MSDWKDRKNLFEWAKKELSQDAVIAWLLSGDYGKEFLLDMCPSLENDIKSVNVTTQEESIDVLVEVKISNDEKIAVIIEDKTDTYLHDFQMLKYIEKITRKGKKNNPAYKKVYFVLFKTGDIHHWEQIDYNGWRDEINGTNDKPARKEFKADDLNKNKIIDGVFVSNPYTNKTDIKFKDGVDVFVEGIYTLKKFQDFLKGKTDGSILDYYKEYINGKEQAKDKDGDEYRVAKEFEGKNNLHLEVVKANGSGKREYEYNLISQEMIIGKKDSLWRFLILPIVAKKVRDGTTTYQFIIHCQLVTDKKTIHGYVPWSQLTKEQRNAFSDFKKSIFEQCKDELEQSEWTLNNNFSKSNDESIDEDGKNNGLQLCKFASENFNDVNLEKLIDTALKIANLARNIK